jgi:hypothetical protein
MISPFYREKMQILAGAIDDLFNGDKKGKDRRVCFVLLIAPFGSNGGRVLYEQWRAQRRRDHDEGDDREIRGAVDKGGGGRHELGMTHQHVSCP